MMAMSQKDADELLELLSRVWDERLSADAAAQLDAFVRRHGAAAAELIVEYSGRHLELGSVVAASRAYERVMAGISAMEAAQAALPLADFPQFGAATTLAGPAADPAEKFASPSKRRQASRRWAPFALASCLALTAAGVWQWVRPGHDSASHLRTESVSLVRPAQPVACVTNLSGARWAGGLDLKVGRTLYQKLRLELEAGTAQISMASGADIVLQAPCTVVLAADDLVVLEQGKLTAQAAKWATGFVVETNGLRITDLGTRFAVSADASGVAEAHVLEGEVLAEPMKAHRPKRSSMLLKSGQAIRVSVPRATIDLIKAQRTKFVDRFTLFRPLRPVEMWNTGIGQPIGSGDAHWRVTAGDPDNGPYPKPAFITHGAQSYLDNLPDASQWISVLDQVWPGAKAKSVHTFQTTFDLTGYDLDTVYIVGLFLVDNAINEVRVNGQPIPFERWETDWEVADFTSFHPIEIVDGFVPGENVIEVDVYNAESHPEHPTEPSPMSLRVEWQAFGCEAAPPVAAN